jgi:hypothetical protein
VPIDQRAGSPAVQRLSAFEYRYLTEFQSHEPEFDYLKSLEIEEKINQVQRKTRDMRLLPLQHVASAQRYRCVLRKTPATALLVPRRSQLAHP